MLAALLTASCGRSGAKDARPVPPAGLAPVTLGELVQLRLAVEGFDTVFDARSEEQDLLPYLVHAWATLYHRFDPAADTRSRYRFTEALCRARLPEDGQARDLLSCMEKLREALYTDLVAVTRAYRRAGRPDRVGEHRLSELERDFLHRRRVYLATRRLREDRRRAVSLPSVTRCVLEQPAVPVVAVGKTSLLMNGFPVLTEPKGLVKLPLVEYELFSSQLEGRLLESPRGPTKGAELIVAAHREVDLQVLGRVLDRAAHQGVTRVCLKVDRVGPFRVPCCLPLRLGPPGVRPTRFLELGPGGALVVDGERRAPLQPGTRLPDQGPRSLHLVAGAFAADLARLCDRAGPEEPLEVLGSASPARRTFP